MGFTPPPPGTEENATWAGSFEPNPLGPPRIHVSQIPYDMFRPVYFAPEVPHVPVFEPNNHPPPRGPSGRQNLRHASSTGGKLGLQPWLTDYQFFAGGYTGIELTTMDKWYQPLDRPGRPRKVHPAQVPFEWLVQFEAPTFPIPTVSTWYEELARPRNPLRIHPSEVPFASYIRLPNVYGCIEAEIDTYYIPRARPVVQMPILYITQWYLYSTAPPPCATTRQSPSSQPPHAVG